jgi:transcriptional regulator with XRE-family HTH domain
MNNVIELFKKWREGKTLQQAGDILGVNRSTVLRWERGESPMPFLVKKLVKEEMKGG